MHNMKCEHCLLWERTPAGSVGICKRLKTATNIADGCDQGITEEDER